MSKLLKPILVEYAPNTFRTIEGVFGLVKTTDSAPIEIPYHCLCTLQKTLDKILVSGLTSSGTASIVVDKGVESTPHEAKEAEV